MDGQEGKLEPSPELKTNLVSRLFFLWVLPFLRGGGRKDLNLEDVYHSLPEDSSAERGKAVEEKWNEEVTGARRKNRRPRMWKVVARLIWRKYSLIGVGYTFDELVLRTIQPLALRNFIKTFEVDHPEDHPDNRRDQYVYAGVLVFATLCHAVFLQKLIGGIIHLGMKCRLGVSSLIYQKVLRLRKTDSKHTNVGKLCNLLSSDVGRLDQSFQMLHFLYIAPLQLALYTYLLWGELGVACLGGMGCVLAILPLQTFTGRFFMYFRFRIAKRTDERGRFLNEILAGVRLIKMYAWEKPFAQLIIKLRQAEIKYIRRSLFLRGMYVSVQLIAAKLIPFCALIFYIAGSHTLTADKAFFTMAIFNNVLQAVMQRVPTAASQLGELLASLNRIEEFLLSNGNGEVAPGKMYHFKDNIAENGTITAGGKETKGEKPRKNEGGTYLVPKIEMKNYSAGWTQEQETLKNLNVNLTGNQLVLVVGHVGSGKSSFLNALLSELPFTSPENGTTDEGYCRVQGRLSYVAQEAWILFPATIRQNILFGLDLDEERYWRVVKLCCLEEDLLQFPEGDQTLVGERGGALSGGQKARVNLARAIYQQADIYLMDDPLSAVDGKVSKELFQGCIRTELEGTLRILVTHQLQYLPMADHVIVLNREGQIWGQGSYDELKQSDIDFTALISENCVNGPLPEGDGHGQDSRKGPELPQRPNKKTADCPKDNGVADNPSESAALQQKEEKKQVGSVGIGTYLRYFKAGGSSVVIALLVSSFLGTQILLNFTDFWLALWTNAVTVDLEKSSTFEHTNNQTRNGDTELMMTGVGSEDQDFYASVYCTIMVVFIFASIFRSILFFWYSMRISVNLHDGMFQSLIRAPVKFFDDNPSGRVMNRFTKDLNHIDEQLPVAFHDFMVTLLGLFGMLALNISANYYTAVPSFLMLVALWRLRIFFLSSARDLKRIESLGKAKSPMFTHVTMTVQGLTTIRALKAQHRVTKQFDVIQDTHTAVYYMIFVTNRWFALWLELLSVTFLATVTLGFLFMTTSGQGGSVGVAITAILSMAGGLQWGVRQSAETENFMTSVERVFEYTNLKPEAPLETPEDEKVSQNWPKEGRLHFQNVSLAYDDPREVKVLENITFSTESQEKVGIVGRTGAGKSSLITALFRLTETCQGSISIDGIPLEKLGLHTLRSKISVIPQDPVLFTGSLRYNLDPFDQFSDAQLRNVLRDVDLHHAVPSLDYPMADGGSNFSVGQRQLVCLARAALRKNRVIVLDEVTANVDPATDHLVQQTIRSKFKDCTILTIAHRLQTVLDSDRILVLDAGKMVEFDKPAVLRENEKSSFYAMWHHQQQQTPVRNEENG